MIYNKDIKKGDIVKCIGSKLDSILTEEYKGHVGLIIDILEDCDIQSEFPYRFLDLTRLKEHNIMVMNADEIEKLD